MLIIVSEITNEWLNWIFTALCCAQADGTLSILKSWNMQMRKVNELSEGTKDSWLEFRSVCSHSTPPCWSSPSHHHLESSEPMWTLSFWKATSNQTAYLCCGTTFLSWRDFFFFWGGLLLLVHISGHQTRAHSMIDDPTWDRAKGHKDSGVFTYHHGSWSKRYVWQHGCPRMPQGCSSHGMILTCSLLPRFPSVLLMSQAWPFSFSSVPSGNP